MRANFIILGLLLLSSLSQAGDLKEQEERRLKIFVSR